MPKQRELFFKRRRKKKGTEYELKKVGIHKPRRISSITREAEEVKDILQDNIVKLRDREGKLEDLVEKGETLEREAEAFQKVQKELYWKMWCRSRKYKIILSSFCTLILVIVVIIVTLYALGTFSSTDM